jgi:cation transporter-like permease
LNSAGRAPKCRLSGAPHLVASVDGIPHQRIPHQRNTVVWLIVYYVVFMIAGDIAAYVIGLVTEREFGGQVSLIVFLALYFLFLWVSWLLAVWMTEPKHAEPAGTGPA